jgi:2-keto-3-deoxy-L-rhamnonate aldolase RhmA
MDYTGMCLKEKVLNGYKATGCMLRLLKGPYAAMFARQTGVDYLFFDTEHGNYSYETLHDMFLTNMFNGITSIVRVPELSKDHISRAFDCGADGVMIPMLDSLEQAKLAVKYAKYAPIGGRGFIAVNGYDQYDAQGKSYPQIMEEQNKKNMLIAQIETKGGIEDADKIAALDGVDMLLIGYGDMSIALGVPGQMDHKLVQDGVTAVMEACKKHNKIFSLAVEFPNFEAKYYKDTGLILHGADSDFLVAGMKNIVAYRDSLKKKFGY